MDLFGANAGAKEVGESGEEQITYTRRKPRLKPHSGRTPLPGYLPRREVTIEPDEDVCCMVKIGEDVTEKVDYTPGKLEVIQYIRPPLRQARGRADRGGSRRRPGSGR